MQKPIIEDAATQRGRLASDKPFELHFGDQYDYVTATSKLLRQSHLKYSTVAKAGSISPSTASNMAHGVTRYPRFSTMTAILGALGYETVFRAGPSAKVIPITKGRAK